MELESSVRLSRWQSFSFSDFELSNVR